MPDPFLFYFHACVTGTLFVNQINNLFEYNKLFCDYVHTYADTDNATTSKEGGCVRIFVYMIVTFVHNI